MKKMLKRVIVAQIMKMDDRCRNRENK